MKCMKLNVQRKLMISQYLDFLLCKIRVSKEPFVPEVSPFDLLFELAECDGRLLPGDHVRNRFPEHVVADTDLLHPTRTRRVATSRGTLRSTSG